jgi:hypothetical protein
METKKLIWNKSIQCVVETDIRDERMKQYLPETLLYHAPEFSKEQVGSLIERIRHHMQKEIALWEEKLEAFINEGLLTSAEVDRLLIGRTRKQKWILYENNTVGGLDLTENMRKDYGCIPCTAVRNHGVAWEMKDNDIDVSMVTSRTRGRGTDWSDSADFGHEGTHAAFAPVPLYIQSDHILLSLAGSNADDLEGHEVASLIYWLTEMVVAVLHEEKRDTETGLPIPTFEDLERFFELWDAIAPGMGFQESYRWIADRGRIDASSRKMLQIAAPTLRICPFIDQFSLGFRIPSMNELQGIFEANK